jgi:hypothetical protein
MSRATFAALSADGAGGAKNDNPLSFHMKTSQTKFCGITHLKVTELAPPGADKKTERRGKSKLSTKSRASDQCPVTIFRNPFTPVLRLMIDSARSPITAAKPSAESQNGGMGPVQARRDVRASI